MNQIIIELQGGLVANVQSNDPDTQVLVIDRDMEGADDDEIGTLSEIEEFIGTETMVPVDTSMSMISDVDYRHLLKVT